MTNLSLARIMFGTNEDLHASSSMNAPAISSLSMLSSEGNMAAKDVSSPSGTLGRLLHKAWAAFRRKT